MAATHYREDLRTIGQTLQARNISVFELKRFANRYTIQGTPDRASSLGSRMRQWLQRVRHGSEPLSLALADVEKLSQAGRAKRSRPGGLTEFRSLPNILRTIGAYLDLSEFELIELQKRAISITLSYRDREGRNEIEERTLSSFYKNFLELCRERAWK
jgi:hypothetical protein